VSSIGPGSSAAFHLWNRNGCDAVPREGLDNLLDLPDFVGPTWLTDTARLMVRTLPLRSSNWRSASSPRRGPGVGRDPDQQEVLFCCLE
jgi:hypothetical protein